MNDAGAISRVSDGLLSSFPLIPTLHFADIKPHHQTRTLILDDSAKPQITPDAIFFLFSLSAISAHGNYGLAKVSARCVK